MNKTMPQLVTIVDNLFIVAFLLVVCVAGISQFFGVGSPDVFLALGILSLNGWAAYNPEQRQRPAYRWIQVISGVPMAGACLQILSGTTSYAYGGWVAGCALFLLVLIFMEKKGLRYE